MHCFQWWCFAHVFQQVRKIGKVARAIAIMSHPIPNTNESHSVQIILPQKQLGRNSDMWGLSQAETIFIWWMTRFTAHLIEWLRNPHLWYFYWSALVRYVFCCSYTHNVAPKGKFIAFVSAEAESDNIQSELKPGIDLLGPVDELFFDMYDRYEPVNEPSLDNCFISTVNFAIHVS